MEKVAQTTRTQLNEECKRKAREDIERDLCTFNKRFKHEVLNEILEDISQTTDRADKLIAMKNDILDLFDCLDVKIKAAITTFEALTNTESYSVGIEFVTNDLRKRLYDGEFVNVAIEKYPQDEDVKLLAKIYLLCDYINEHN